MIDHFILYEETARTAETICCVSESILAGKLVTFAIAASAAAISAAGNCPHCGSWITIRTVREVVNG